MSEIALVPKQMRYDLMLWFRNRQSRFFTVAFPLLLLLVFMTVLGDQLRSFEQTRIKLSTYYVPAMLVLGIASASYVNLVVTVTALRERGVLKRRRATPVPAWVLISGRALAATAISLTIVALLTAVGWIFYGVKLPVSEIPFVILATLVGSASFCCLGYATASFVGPEDATIPVTQGIILPLYFVSGVFIHESYLPSLFRSIGDVFPIRHLLHAMLHSFDTGKVVGPGQAIDLAVVAAWGIVGLVVALRRFSWSPRAV
jgi:ABC-2 type transport system permease protein